MYPLFFYPPVILHTDVDGVPPGLVLLPPPPLSWTLALAGAVTFVTALVWTLT